MKTLTLLLLPILLLLPLTSATQVSGDTYAIANSDQAVFTDAVVVGNDVYLLMSAAVYKFNLTDYTLTKVFDAGFNYILSSIIYADGGFYISGYKLYSAATGTGGGGDFQPVVTCPLPLQNYNIDNFTVWKLDTSFRVLKSQVLHNEIYNISNFYALQAMKLFYVNGELYTAIFDTDLNSKATSHIYQVDLDSGYTEKLAVQDKIIAAAYGGGYWYLLNENNTVTRYSSTFQEEATMQDNIHSLRIKSIYADDNYVYLAGRGLDSSSTWGAAVEVLTLNFSMVYYHQFSDSYQFYSVYAAAKYVIVAESGTLYAIDYANNTVADEFKNSLSNVYDMKTENFIDIHNNGPHTITIVAWNNSGNMSFAWGGFYSDSEFLYAYMVLTDKSSSIPFNPGDSGSGYIPYPLNDLWEKYKWYILLGGGLFLILLLSPRGGNKEVR